MNDKYSNFNSNDYEPKRFGLRYNPPQIVIEYFKPSIKKLFHHKIRLYKLKQDSKIEDIVKELFEKHSKYLSEKIKKQQLESLVEKLKNNIFLAQFNKENFGKYFI